MERAIRKIEHGEGIFGSGKNYGGEGWGQHKKKRKFKKYEKKVMVSERRRGTNFVPKEKKGYTQEGNQLPNQWSTTEFTTPS